jgi:LAO/AO transport system kinase
VNEAAGSVEQLVAGAIALEKWPLAQLVRRFEDPRPEAVPEKAAAIAALEARGARPRAMVAGFTGTPGSGKSTLVGELAARLVARDPAVTVAVLAIDPSSHRSGGSILGDRTRVHFPIGERRLYFRSQPSDRELGGMGRATYPVVRLLERLFDYVFVETVGIGQSEIEIERLADRVYLVLQPLGGDQVQFMKAGIMEVPHAFILNKCDVGAAARRSYHALRASIDFARPGEPALPPIFRTSAISGEGLDDVLDDLTGHRSVHDEAARRHRDRYFFEKWVRDEYGRFGLGLLERQGGAEGLLERAGGFEAAQGAYRAPCDPFAQA